MFNNMSGGVHCIIDERHTSCVLDIYLEVPIVDELKVDYYTIDCRNSQKLDQITQDRYNGIPSY